MSFLGKLFFIQALMGLHLADSTVLSTFRTVSFLPDWTNSVYRTQQNGIPTLIVCASICVNEVDEKCSFFYFHSNTCFLGNLTLNNTGLASLFAPNKILVDESKLCRILLPIKPFYCFIFNIYSILHI